MFLSRDPSVQSLGGCTQGHVGNVQVVARSAAYSAYRGREAHTETVGGHARASRLVGQPVKD